MTGRNGSSPSFIYVRNRSMCAGWGESMGKRIVCIALLMAIICTPALAQTAYVNNGNDPQSQLNLRSQPDAQSSSLGRFYSGTQVEILADAGGGWAQVCLCGSDAIRGYMMSSYLSGDGSGVIDARVDKQVVSPYGTPAVVLRDRPSNSYGAAAMLAVGEMVKVIGISGDFCYVQRADGSVGCLAAEELR